MKVDSTVSAPGVTFDGNQLAGALFDLSALLFAVRQHAAAIEAGELDDVDGQVHLIGRSIRQVARRLQSIAGPLMDCSIQTDVPEAANILAAELECEAMPLVHQPAGVQP